MTETGKGVAALVLACIIWGLAPIFYKELSHVDPAEVLGHRTLWSFVTFGGVLVLQGRLSAMVAALSVPRQLGLTCLAAVFITINWFVFIWAIAVGRALEGSIGYYIFPLVAVVAGWLVLGERLARVQWLAVGLAAAAVLVLTLGLGVAPWVSIVLAVSFTCYGLIKRWIDAGPVVSVTVETLLLAPFMLVFLAMRGESAFGGTSFDTIMLVLSGPVTAVPLILFSYAAKRVAMTTMGLIQYLNPTLQFLVAWQLFGEPVTGWHGLALPMIWLALAIYSVSAIRRARRGAAPT